MAKQLFSPRVQLIPCDQQLLSVILEGRAAMANFLGADVPENWTEFGLDPILWTQELLASDPGHANWITYLGIHRKDQRLISTCGYKGKPDAEGVVEIGYEVHPDYRKRGLATEIARTLVQNAFAHPGVGIVMAHTLPTLNASGAVLSKAGFAFAGEVIDPEDGPIWQWQAILQHE